MSTFWKSKYAILVQNESVNKIYIYKIEIYAHSKNSI